MFNGGFTGMRNNLICATGPELDLNDNMKVLIFLISGHEGTMSDTIVCYAVSNLEKRMS